MFEKYNNPTTITFDLFILFGRGQLKLSKPLMFRLVIFECHVSVNMRTSNFEIKVFLIYI